MALAHNSKSLSLDANPFSASAILSGECLKDDGSWTKATIDLNRIIGNDNGKFDLTSRFFLSSAQRVRLEEGTTYLRASLPTTSGLVEASLDLGLVLRVLNGQFRFIILKKLKNERIISTASCFLLKNGGRELHGLCLNRYGKLQASWIDLNQYYSIERGVFQSAYGTADEPGNFARDVVEVGLDPTPYGIFLRAKVRDPSSEDFVYTTIDLNIDIVNYDGNFVFEKQSGPFDRDGILANYFGAKPVASFVVAMMQYTSATGNNYQWSIRAIAEGIPSESVIVATQMAACLGPVYSAIAGALAMPFGILAKETILDSIEDEGIRAQFGRSTIGGYIWETFTKMLSNYAATEHFREWITVMINDAAYEATGIFLLQRAQRHAGIFRVLKPIQGIVISTFVAQLLDALITKKLPTEWLEAQSEMAKRNSDYKPRKHDEL